ncbi:response regulator with putative antiterminator output domain [Mycolicibacterium phlei]|jgi:hypothetical protein|uniref:Hisitidine kinase n=1 Tax=Mycolicibacterium phlei DSM 43239 = CCUG 21000 TaxID=1226750 RepID=A0A5N5V652_MYCPH|nr:ANTAR domain-containing protein [Mycolicibacterium phlei]VEG10423.1 response regulator with putative antiterminator output domain [Mycobacteroides chelonae]AMO62321.1 ANTAR domain protein [Mycolicibacterium phlei]EID10294.1 response regulator with putative antiterminator output domain [Mycolicibacterium phlei RIVM601174]KAB7757351.1 hisitidine kinase [Mycolicibacterium phlei DSM 43239 = CCUG 21000]KXW66247.1 hisitidine kinase [Mycolicibacterium phlei DSM 43239 = CCUG 21000]
MSHFSRRAHDTSRTVIDHAVGVLVGLRGCSPDEAFAELVRVVRQTGIGIGSVAAGLVAVASGSASAEHAEAFAVWGELVARKRITVS